MATGLASGSPGTPSCTSFRSLEPEEYNSTKNNTFHHISFSHGGFWKFLFQQYLRTSISLPQAAEKFGSPLTPWKTSHLRQWTIFSPNSLVLHSTCSGHNHRKNLTSVWRFIVCKSFRPVYYIFGSSQQLCEMKREDIPQFCKCIMKHRRNNLETKFGITSNSKSCALSLCLTTIWTQSRIFLWDNCTFTSKRRMFRMVVSRSWGRSEGEMGEYNVYRISGFWD